MRHEVWSSSKPVFSTLLLGLVLAAGTAVIVAAQESGKETETKTKVTIKEGKNIKATGCVTQCETGALMLTGVADKKGPLPDYILVLEDDQEKDLEKEVGHQVQVKGHHQPGRRQGQVRGRGKGQGHVRRRAEDRAEVGGLRRPEAATAGREVVQDAGGRLPVTAIMHRRRRSKQIM